MAIIIKTILQKLKRVEFHFINYLLNEKLYLTAFAATSNRCINIACEPLELRNRIHYVH